jgi:S1-C subfamily serine protease
VLAGALSLACARLSAQAAAPAGPTEAAAAAKDEPPPPEIEKSTVKIFVTKRGPNVFQPWMKQQPSDRTASGVVIEGKRILTTAQAVAYSNDIQVQANQAGDKISASVVLMNWGMNLAVLRLDDESFFDTHPPIPRAEGLPLIKDPMLVYGFPVGGNSLSVTKGIISRVEFSGGFPEYTLRIQIDAAINEGNAGGPAVSNGKMVGVALSRLNNAEKIGYVIPNEEIEIFLKDLPSGTPAEASNFYDFCQTAENPTLRRFLGLPKDASGVAVRTVYTGDAAYPIRQWDVIQKIGDYPVDDQGMVRVGELRLDFHYAVRREAREGKVPMDVLRQGKALHVDVPLSKREMVVPGVSGLYPPYFIYGPIVFTRATQALCVGAMEGMNLRATLGWDRSPIAERRGDTAAFPGEEIVVVPGPFFPNDLVKGYEQKPFVHTVDTVDGVKVRNLRHLVELLRDAAGDYVTIAFAERFKGAVVLPRKETLAAMDGILADNGIREQGSPDLLQVWNAKPAP